LAGFKAFAARSVLASVPPSIPEILRGRQDGMMEERAGSG
jgi:hypothetical protein